MSDKNCFVFVFGINGIFACLFKGKTVKNISFFDIHSDKTIDDIVHDIEDYLASMHRIPIKIIIDGIGQSFVSKGVLKTLKPKELKQFLASKLASDVKSAPGAIKNARLIKADNGEKTNEYLLSSISFDQSFNKILRAISVSHHNLLSFHSSAAELNDIASPIEITESGKRIVDKNIANRPIATTSKTLGKAANKTIDDAVFTYDASSRTGTAGVKSTNRQWVITVAMLETSGLRITIGVGSSIVLTRVKRLTGHSFNETSALIKTEIDNVIGYVEKSSMMPRSKLFMNIFGSRDFVSIIEALAPDVGTINMFLMQDYIASSKNKALSKEYTYPSVLALAYKVVQNPFINYYDDEFTLNKTITKINRLILVFTFVIFVAFNSYSILKFIPALRLKKNYHKYFEEEKKAYNELAVVKTRIGNTDIHKNLAIAKFYESNNFRLAFEDDFGNIVKILSKFDVINIYDILYEADQNTSTNVFKAKIYLNDQTQQEIVINQIKDNDSGYDVNIENINQENGAIIIKFVKKTNTFN